ncbi:MAG TPA: KGG domain-containing protein [Flavisolibacter sp.]|nr:KGG domain-containing protein [Flavisolibacter sp.]
MEETNQQSERAGSNEPRRPLRRGFAAMDSEKQRQIASQGGRAAHQQGVAHRWTSAEASEAGRKGGQNSRGSRNSGDGQSRP